MAEAQRKSAQTKMQHVLTRLGISLEVVWTPDGSRDKHGLIEESSRTIFLFDKTEAEAWATFTHEILEFQPKDFTKTYRALINSMIEAFERLAYERMETFLESILEVLKNIEEQRMNNA